MNKFPYTKQNEANSAPWKRSVNDSKYRVRETQNQDLLFRALKFKKIEEEKKRSKDVILEESPEVFAYPENIIS